MKKTTMNTINGQLIKKFKHELEPEYSKLNLQSPRSNIKLSARSLLTVLVLPTFTNPS